MSDENEYTEYDENILYTSLIPYGKLIQKMVDEFNKPTGTPNARFLEFGNLVKEGEEIFSPEQMDDVCINDIQIEYIHTSGIVKFRFMNMYFGDTERGREFLKYMAKFDEYGIDLYGDSIEISLKYNDIYDEELEE